MNNKTKIVDERQSSHLCLFRPKEFVISIILGLAGFLCSYFTLSFNNPPFSISILWSYLFPLLAGMAYGGRYGLISGVVGLGAFFPFILWPTNGWANLVTAILYVVLFSWMGYFGKLRQKQPSLWNNPLLISIPYLLLYFYISYLLYPVAFSSNPPFWEPKAETSISTTVLAGMLTKGVALMYLYIVIDVAILKVPFIRKLLGLEIKRESRINGKIIILSLLGSLLVWYVLNTFYGIFIYKTFPQSLLNLSSPYEIIAAVVFISAGFLVGYILSLYMESRIKAEEKVLESEHRYKTLAEQIASLGFWSSDIRSGHMSWSDEIFHILGIQPLKPPVDLKILESLIHPDDRADVLKTLINDGNEVKPQDIQYRIIRPDGTIRFVHSIGIVSNDVDGKPTLMFGILLDITERKKLMEKLEHSSSQNKLILDSAGEGVLGLDIQGNHTFINLAAAKMLGYEVDELIGKHSHAIWHYKKPDGSPYPNEECPIHKALKDGAIHRIDNEVFWKKDGTNFPVEYTSTPIQEEGKVVGTVIVFNDVTERKQAEEKIKQIAKEWQSTFDSITDLVSIQDRNFKLARVNKAYADAFQKKPEDLAGRHCYVVVHKTSCPVDNCPHEKALKTKASTTSEIFEPILGVHLEISCSPIFNEHGEMDGTIHIAKNITERKQMQTKLEEMATHDYLTGLPNRVLLIDRFTIASALARRNKARLAVMSLDLDKFKPINDTLGHEAGDQVLKVFSARLSGIIRASDTIARVGGDEFMLLMLETKRREDATAIAQKILDSCTEPLSIDGHRLHLSTSIGIAIYPEDGEDMETLTKKSDAAMYYSKGHGRNQFKFFGDGDVRISGDHKSGTLI